ncbi:MAG: hypothetical protein ACRESJ_17410 [Pseudomonas sp.]|uniref:hypothetical protein n=1 Tax=Pseudomonas sp. TaxID=306 RepID=UPI003D6E8AF2
MSSPMYKSEEELHYQFQLEALRSHEKHMRHIYGLRWAALALAALTIVIGAVMVFMGLQGSFNWAVEAPNSIGAKLTNASPGIIFASVGMVIGFVVILQKPVSYDTGGASGFGDSDNGTLLGGPRRWGRR